VHQIPRFSPETHGVALGIGNSGSNALNEPVLVHQIPRFSPETHGVALGIGNSGSNALAYDTLQVPLGTHVIRGFRHDVSFTRFSWCLPYLENAICGL
jgi:hypothetical protein